MQTTAACYNHPDRPAKKGCWRCQQMICDECSTQLTGKTYCKKCASEVAKMQAPGEQGNILKKEVNSPALMVVIIVITLIIAAVEIFVMTR